MDWKPWRLAALIGAVVAGLSSCVLPLPIGYERAEISKTELSVKELETVAPGYAIALVATTASSPSVLNAPIPTDDSLVDCFDEKFKTALSPTKVFLPSEYEAIQQAKNVDMVKSSSLTPDWAESDRIHEINVKEKIKYLIALEQSTIKLGESGGVDFGLGDESLPVAGVGFWERDEESTLRAIILDAESIKEAGRIAITVEYDTAGGGIGLAPFYVVGGEIVIVDSVLCHEMAKQLIKVFGGTEPSR
jgi:hypothetical protein